MLISTHSRSCATQRHWRLRPAHLSGGSADSMGSAGARAILNNRRIRAGNNLNGSMYGPVMAAGLDRPFLLMYSQLRDMGGDATWAEPRSPRRGWRT